MSMSWYPTGWEIYVDNPGYGEMYVVLAEQGWSRTFVGEEVASFLAEVTGLALGTIEHASVYSARVTQAMARDLLPALQRAVVLAAAATDRYERLFRDPDDMPAQPMCVRCDEGADFPSDADFCGRHGHTAFGLGAETRWDRAESMYGTQRARWERMRKAPA